MNGESSGGAAYTTAGARTAQHCDIDLRPASRPLPTASPPPAAVGRVCPDEASYYDMTTDQRRAERARVEQVPEAPGAAPRDISSNRHKPKTGAAAGLRHRHRK